MIRPLALGLCLASAIAQPALAARDAASAQAPGYVAPSIPHQRDARLTKTEQATFVAKVDGLWRRILATSPMPQPKGFSIFRQIIVHRPDGPLPDWTPTAAHGDMLLRAIELDGGSKQRPDGTWTGVGEGPTLQFTINDPTALFYNPVEEDMANGLLAVPTHLKERGGFPVLEFKSRAHIVIAKPGKLPYRYTTKAEFLRYQVADLKSVIAKFGPGEAPQLEKSLREKEAELAQLPPEERDARACQSGEFKYGTFTPCEMADAHYLVRLDPDYFDRALPKTAIQLITISVPNHARDDDKMLAPVIRKAVDELDLQELQRMLE